MEEYETFTTPSSASDPNATTSNMTSSSSSSLFTAKVTVQAVILALAIFGNSCLLLVMRVRKRHYTRMQIFIIHLCFADMLVAFFNILPQLIWEIVGEWVAGDLMCRCVKFMQIFVMYLSTYILVLTALDRRRAICNPLTSHTWTSRLVHLSVAFVYALSAILSIPQAIIFKYQEISPGSGVKNCWVHFEPEWTLQFYITTFTALVYVIPLIILVYAYVSIYYTIFKRAKQSKRENRGYYVTPSCGSEKSGNHSDNEIKTDHSPMSQEGSKHIRTFIPRSSSYAGLSRAKLKTVKLTLVIIMAYVGCWSPFFISQLWWLYDEHAPGNSK